jgi:hypothetical protein
MNGAKAAQKRERARAKLDGQSKNTGGGAAGMAARKGATATQTICQICRVRMRSLSVCVASLDAHSANDEDADELPRDAVKVAARDPPRRQAC